MNRLLEIAKELKPLYTRRAGLQFDLLIAEGAVNGTKVMITPEGGWPGKNDAERNAARDAAYLASGDLRVLELHARDLRGELLHTEAEIDGLEAERRALEWEIRDQMVEDVRRLPNLEDVLGEPVSENVYNAEG